MKEQIIKSIVENAVSRSSLQKLQNALKLVIYKELEDKDISELIDIAKADGLKIPLVFEYMSPNLYSRLKSDGCFMGLALTRDGESYILAQVDSLSYAAISLRGGNRYKKAYPTNSYSRMADDEIEAIFKPRIYDRNIVWDLKK